MRKAPITEKRTLRVVGRREAGPGSIGMRYLPTVNAKNGRPSSNSQLLCMGAASNALPAPVPTRAGRKVGTTNELLGRSREHLTPDEVDAIQKAMLKFNRKGWRDAFMVEFAYRHGLRVSELVEFKRSDVKLNERRVWVRRKKRGISNYHSISVNEIRDLKRLMKDGRSEHLFVSALGKPFTTKGFEQM